MIDNGQTQTENGNGHITLFKFQDPLQTTQGMGEDNHFKFTTDLKWQVLPRSNKLPTKAVQI